MLTVNLFRTGSCDSGMLRKPKFGSRCGILSATPFAFTLLGVLTSLLLISKASASEDVDILLILAADVSYSIDTARFNLQRKGYADAFKSEKVLSAIKSGSSGRIAVEFIEWSGESWQERVVDWTLISDVASARSFADKLLAAPRSFSERTSISGAIYFSIQELGRAPFESKRRVIDISGNGANNAGRSVTVARDEASSRGITINALVILDGSHADTAPLEAPEGLEAYFRKNVTAGLNAFVLVTQDFASFGEALVTKLTTEIAGTTSDAPQEASACLMRNTRTVGQCDNTHQTQQKAAALATFAWRR